ncbi:MAG: hypothetical protein GY833_24290 [Aestuariibacter sp.]|nr:hypothetical protein [Aestuariibacter sp.]
MTEQRNPQATSRHQQPFSANITANSEPSSDHGQSSGRIFQQQHMLGQQSPARSMSPPSRGASYSSPPLSPGSSYSARDGCLGYVRMTAFAKLSRFVGRLPRYRQMDFEFAAWQMLYLLVAPKKVYRNFMYRKSKAAAKCREQLSTCPSRLDSMPPSCRYLTLSLRRGTHGPPAVGRSNRGFIAGPPGVIRRVDRGCGFVRVNRGFVTSVTRG